MPHLFQGLDCFGNDDTFSGRKFSLSLNQIRKTRVSSFACFHGNFFEAKVAPSRCFTYSILCSRFRRMQEGEMNATIQDILGKPCNSNFKHTRFTIFYLTLYSTFVKLLIRYGSGSVQIEKINKKCSEIGNNCNFIKICKVDLEQLRGFLPKVIFFPKQLDPDPHWETAWSGSADPQPCKKTSWCFQWTDELYNSWKIDHHKYIFSSFS